MAGGPEFDVALEVKSAGFVRGTREASAATKDLTSSTRESGDASRRAASASDTLEAAERRRLQAAADLVRSVKSQISIMAEYQRQLIATASAESARAAAAARAQQRQVADTGVDPSSRLGAAMQSLLERQRQLRITVQESTAEIARADRVTANISGLQARTRAMEEALAIAKQSEHAERAFAEAMEVRRQVEASGARPGTDQSAQVEREVRAQQRLEAELRAVASARERDRREAQQAQDNAARIAEEVSRLREATAQLGILAAAHLRGAAAVREANISLEVRNALLRAGVAAGSADAHAIESEIRAQAKLRQQIDETTNATRRETSATDALRNAFYAVQGAIAALGLSALVRDAVQSALAIERAQKALVAATGTSAGAAREIAFVRAEAERLGLVFTDTAVAYAGLAAASRNTRLEGSATRDIFSAVSEASTVMGLSADQAKGALLSIQQMMSKGTVQAEELRGQLGERLPGAFQIAARAMGMTTAELGKNLEQGKVLATDLLPKLAAEMRKTFGAGLVNAVNSSQAQLNRLQNAFTELKSEIGEGFLTGFLAGFNELRKNLSGEELRQASRDLGETIGKALKIAADAAALLAKNLHLVKAVLITIIALKGAAAFLAMRAAIAEAGGLIAALTGLKAALLALPLAAIAFALSLLIVQMDKYAERQRIALSAELDRVQKSNELFSYYDTLKAKKEGLTQEEVRYATEVRKTLVAERTKLTVALAAAEAAARASAQRAAAPDPRTGVAPYVDVEGAVRRNQAVRDLQREVQTVTSQLKILNDEWVRLGKLDPPKLAPEDKGLDKTAQKIRDLMEGFRRQAEQAERLRKANAESAASEQAVTRAIERENAAYQALHSIEGLSAAAKAKLTIVIEGLVGSVQSDTLAIQLNTAARERSIAAIDQVREAEARLRDAWAESTEASRTLAAQLEAEAIAREQSRETETAYVAELAKGILARNEHIRSIDIEISRVERAREGEQNRLGLQAQLADAVNQSTAATREHATWLESERILIDKGIAAWEPRAQQIRQEIAERALARQGIEQQIAAQNRLNEAEAAAKRSQAEFADWQEEIAAVKRYGSEVARILQQYGLLNSASRELSIKERVIAAARAEGVAFLRLANGELAAATAEDLFRVIAIENQVRGQEKQLELLNQQRAAYAIQARLLEPLKQAWGEVSSQISDAFVTLVVDGEVAWKDLANSLLKTMVGAILEVLKQWILAEQIKRAEAIKTAAISRAALQSGNYGPTQNGGNLATGGAIPGTAGAGGGGSAAGATANTLAGAALAAYALYVVYIAFIRDNSVRFAEASTRGAQSYNTRNSGKLLRQVQQLITGIIKEANDIAVAWKLAITQVGDVTLGKRDKKFYVKDAENLIGQAFDSAEAAIEYAKVRALQLADVSTKVSNIVQAALRFSRAKTLEGLKSDLDFAKLLENAGLEKSLAELKDQLATFVDDFAANWKRAIELFSRDLPALAQALNGVAQLEIAGWQSARDAITGRQRTQAEELQLQQARARIWNAEMQVRRADLAMMAIELRARIALAQAYSGRTGGGGTGSGGSGNRGTGDGTGTTVISGILAFSSAMVQTGQVAVTTAAVMTGAAVTQLDALRAQLSAIEALQLALDQIPLIDPGEITLRGGGGGGDNKAADQQRLRDILADAAWQEAIRNLSDYKRGLAEINKKWDEAEVLAHGNAELLAKIAEARRKEIEALRQQEREKHKEGLKPWLADFGKSDWQIGLQDLNKQFDEAREKARELGEAIWKVDLAERRAAEALGRQAIASLNLPTDQTTAQFKALGDTLNFLRRNQQELGISTEELARVTSELGNQLYGSLVDSLLKYVQDEQVKKDLTELRYQMEIANIKLQFELVKGLHVLTDEQVAVVQDLIDRLPANAPGGGTGPDDQGGGGGGGGGGVLNSGSDAQQRLEDLQRQRQEAADRLRGYEDLGLSPLALEIRRVNEDFESLRAILGNTERVQRAYNLAIQDVMNRFLQPIRELQDSLSLTEYSPLRAMDRLRQAQEQFQRSLAALQSGDLSQLQNIASYAQTYLQEALAALPQGSASYQRIYDQVNAALAAILNQYGPQGSGDTTRENQIGPGGPGSPTPGNTPASPPPINLGPVVDQLQDGTDRELQELRGIRIEAQGTRQEVYRLRQRFDSPVAVYDSTT